jgi:hypothetical protein
MWVKVKSEGRVLRGGSIRLALGVVQRSAIDRELQELEQGCQVQVEA